MAAGDVNGAEVTMRRLLQIRPNQQSGWLLLSVALTNLGDTKGANGALENAIANSGLEYDAEAARVHLLDQMESIPGGMIAKEALQHN
jgi:cytochrome c-type biogenesis protein CcmH/NrfG